MNRLFFIIILISACAPRMSDPFIPPTTKQPTDRPNSLSEKLLTEYDIWEFLKENPKESEVIEMLGSPDSVWVSDEQPYYVLYYFRPALQDYNSIEFNIKFRKVTGYEWDEQ